MRTVQSSDEHPAACRNGHKAEQGGTMSINANRHVIPGKLKTAALSSASVLAISLQLIAPQALAQAQVAGLEEIVVTAQRRAENIQDIPLSITVVDPKKLEGLR